MQDDNIDAQLRDAILAEPLETAALDARIRGELKTIEPRIQRGKWIAAVGIAALLALAIGGYWLAPNRGNAATCVDAAEDHRVEVVEQSHRNWLTNAAAIQTLAARQGLSAPVAETIAPPGYHMARGKLCRLGGRVFLHLVYTDGSHEFSFFLRNRAGAGSTVSDNGEQHVAQISSDRYTAVVVTNESRAAAISIAQFAATRL